MPNSPAIPTNPSPGRARSICRRWMCWTYRRCSRRWWRGCRQTPWWPVSHSMPRSISPSCAVAVTSPDYNGNSNWWPNRDSYLPSRALHPTPYRYSTLIDRAKHLVTIAQQVEAAYLTALEKRDTEAYNLFKASQDLGLAQANVQLQDLRVSEATDSLTLANRQQQRAQFQVNTYRDFLDTGMSQWERKLLVDYQQANAARIIMATLDGALTSAPSGEHCQQRWVFGYGCQCGLCQCGHHCVGGRSQSQCGYRSQHH